MATVESTARQASNRGSAGRWAAVVVLAALVPSVVAAAGVEITTTNDLGAGNPFEDDRYTASFRATWSFGGHFVTFDEHMFTDREAGRRFDESWLQVQGPLRSGGRGAIAWRLGVVRVGRGLIGERGQNVVHDVVGSHRVSLEYDPGHRMHLAAGLEWNRRLFRGARTLTFARAELASAPGFRSHAEVGVDAVRTVGRAALLSASAGVRASHTDHDLLARHQRDWSPVWEVGVTWRGLVRVAWSANRLGVEQRHLHVGLRVPVLGAR